MSGLTDADRATPLGITACISAQSGASRLPATSFIASRAFFGTAVSRVGSSLPRVQSSFAQSSLSRCPECLLEAPRGGISRGWNEGKRGALPEPLQQLVSELVSLAFTPVWFTEIDPHCA